jgi:hypothetical protein
LRAIQENFEEDYVKAKKKKKKKRSGMEGECLSILRGAKEVSIEERHSKCNKKKSSSISFGVFRIKPLVSSKRLDWLFIKEKVGFAL